MLKLNTEKRYSFLTMPQMMLWVLIALIPAILCQVILFGLATLVQMVLAVGAAIVCEACCLKLRQKPIGKTIGDYSAIVSALLLALSIPSTSPWWLIVIGVFFAIVVAKQLYGGLGQNIFNPAMVGYVVLLVAFPVQMTAWPTYHLLTHSQAVHLIFWPEVARFDSITSATVLSALREATTAGLPHWLDRFSLFAMHSPWSWVNLSYLLGGIILLIKKVIDWRLPCAALATLVLLSFGYHELSHNGAQTLSVLDHLFSGATMMGIFFIMTDPVTAATSHKGRIYFAILFATLVFVIRTWGSYPDAVAFATLLANLCAPFIDYFTRPKVYGHE